MTDFQRRGRLWVPEAPMLNLIRSVELELASPAMGIAGVYGYEVGPDLAAGQVRARGEFHNLITDAGLDALGGTNIATLTGYFAVGTGSAPPAVGDGGLQTQIGPRINATGGFSIVSGYNATTDPANPYWYRRVPRVWSKGAFGGDVSLTELGVFSAATGGVCWSRQLFRDGGGLPTTVSVLAGEELKVWYEYRLYPPMTDVVQTMTIKGVSTTITNRACNISYISAWGNAIWNWGTWATKSGANATVAAAQNQTLPARTSSPAGIYMVPTTITLAPYVGGSRARGYLVRFNPSDANFSGGLVGGFNYVPYDVSSMTSTYIPLFTHLNPAPVKTTEEYLNLDVNFAWARTPNPTI